MGDIEDDEGEAGVMIVCGNVCKLEESEEGKFVSMVVGTWESVSMGGFTRCSDCTSGEESDGESFLVRAGEEERDFKVKES